MTPQSTSNLIRWRNITSPRFWSACHGDAVPWKNVGCKSWFWGYSNWWAPTLGFWGLFPSYRGPCFLLPYHTAMLHIILLFAFLLVIAGKVSVMDTWFAVFAKGRCTLTLLPVCRKSTVADLFDFADRVTIDIVAKVEHVQLDRLVESGRFLSPECRTSFRLCCQCVRRAFRHLVDFVDFRQSRLCQIRLCRQCVPALTLQ